MQILNGEEAQREIDQTENTPSEKPVPRGLMYDRNHNLILDNNPVKSITYTPPKHGQTADERLELAEDLAEYITIIKDQEELKEEITERDKKRILVYSKYRRSRRPLNGKRKGARRWRQVSG